MPLCRSHDSIESRMAKAVAIAERKLAEAKAQKAGGNTAGPEAELAASDDTAMLEAVEKGKFGHQSVDQYFWWRAPLLLQHGLVLYQD